MHAGACKTGSSHKPECIGTTNPDRSVLILITIITWHFQFHPVNVNNLHVKGAYVLEARAVSRASPFVTSRGAPWRRDCRLTMPVGKGRCDALPHAFHIGVFKFGHYERYMSCDYRWLLSFQENQAKERHVLQGIYNYLKKSKIEHIHHFQSSIIRPMFMKLPCLYLNEIA